MNERTAKLLANYAKESGRPRKEVKDWWKSLVEEDKDRARRNMTAFVDGRRRNRLGGATKVGPKETVRKEV